MSIRRTDAHRVALDLMAKGDRKNGIALWQTAESVTDKAEALPVLSPSQFGVARGTQESARKSA